MLDAPLPGGLRGTGVELRRRHNVSHDFLNLNLTRNLNLPKDFGGKSKSRSKIAITIKNFVKCLNSMAVPGPLPRGEFLFSLLQARGRSAEFQSISISRNRRSPRRFF